VSAPLQIMAPLAGLNAVRSGHSKRTATPRRASKYGERFFHFFLPGQDGREWPLNCVLSDKDDGVHPQRDR